MMIRAYFGVLALAGLSACQPAAPEDSNFGVGFNQTFEAQKVNRDAALAGSVPAAPGVTSGPIGATLAAGSNEALAADTARILAQTDPNAAASAANSGVAPVIASPGNPAPELVNSTGISQENNFDAVSGRRSIENDAARIASNRAQYHVVQPEALPERESAGPNIVAYALKTTNPVGTPVYKRGGFNKKGKYERNCAQIPQPDLAQIAFLEAGGPMQDPKGMDPDGDGYACDWDPAPFRQAGVQE